MREITCVQLSLNRMLGVERVSKTSTVFSTPRFKFVIAGTGRVTYTMAARLGQNIVSTCRSVIFVRQWEKIG
jgi:hypothetical protein